jgi:hypothetical protein
MKNNSLLRNLCLGAALLCSNCTQPASKPVASPALAPPDAKDIQADLNVLPTDELKVKIYAEGFQVYKRDSVTQTWKPDRPEAVLFDENHKIIGRHYKSSGPTWESADGSMVVANGDKATIKFDTTHAGNIPWLLLVTKETKGNPAGIFSQVSKIQRLYTEGGKQPAGTIPPSNTNTALYVAYKATYYFYSSAVTK